MFKGVFCLMGPTASGKTALALELAAQFPIEIVSVDSALVYREMDIGTAKPSKSELAQVPHHLMDILFPTESYSAARFCEDAKTLIEGIIKRERIPLLVGGTMMYFNALQQGLAVLPDANEAVRQRLAQEALTDGLAALHARLQTIDPEAAKRIHAHDEKRIQRALEVYELTGESLTFLHQKAKAQLPYRFMNMCLEPLDRASLHERIAKRFHLMLSQGFIDEVRYLKDKWALNEQHPSMRSVGYRQVFAYVNGLDSYDACVEKSIAATRQLAKRQLTWIRHWPDGEHLFCDAPHIGQTLVAKVKEILDNSVSFE